VICFTGYQFISGHYTRWLSLSSTVSATLVQITFNRSACRSPTSLVGHMSTLPNVVICWFIRSELSLADRVSTLQLLSSGTRFWHRCTVPPLVVDSSEMGLKPSSSYKPTHDPLRTSVLRVYLLTYLLTYFVNPIIMEFRHTQYLSVTKTPIYYITVC